jgi:hypothetical protein
MSLQEDASRELIARIGKLAHEASPTEVNQLAEALAWLTGSSKPSDNATGAKSS